MCSEGLQSHSKWASRGGLGGGHRLLATILVFLPFLAALPVAHYALLFLLFIHSVDKLGRAPQEGPGSCPQGGPTLGTHTSQAAQIQSYEG